MKTWPVLMIALMFTAEPLVAARVAGKGTRRRAAEPRDELGRTPLMRAARDGDLAAITHLLSRGAGLEARSKGRWTPLMYAVAARHREAVQFLLAHGANPRVRGREETSALGNAFGDLRMTEALVRAGANVNDPHIALLASAASNGLIDFVEGLLRLGANVEGSKYERPLEAAIQRRGAIRDPNTPRMVALLLHAGARPSGQALEVALYVERSDANRPITELLLQAGADVQERDPVGWTPLHHAVLNKDAVAVKSLLEAGARMDAEDAFHRTALDLALLLQKGANVQATAGRSPLTTAASTGHSEIVKLLRAAGARPGSEVAATLAQAARRLEVAAVDLLLEIGADPNTSTFGWTALGLALGDPQVSAPGGGPAEPERVRGATLAIMKRLLATPNFSQASKDDALLHAADRQPLEIIQMLVEAGADPRTANANFLSVRENAERNPDRAVMEYLRKL
jgi:uncharacterized protein